LSSLEHYFSCSNVFGGLDLAARPSLFVLLHYPLVFFGTINSLYHCLVKTQSTFLRFSSLFRSFSLGFAILSCINGIKVAFTPSSWARSFFDYRPCPLPFLSFACPFFLFSSLTGFFSWSYEAWLSFFIHSVFSRPSFSSFVFLSGWQNLFILS
jgi:hypothetical protein